MSSNHYEEIGLAALAMSLQEQPVLPYAEPQGIAGLKNAPATQYAAGAAWVRPVKVGRAYAPGARNCGGHIHGWGV